MENLNRASVVRFPEILWWDLDPDSGQFTEEPAPKGAPSKFDSLEAITKFKFRIDINGSVKVGD
jgi:hypothetical protein